MSQKREKEETVELKVPTTEALKTALCPENCKISAASNVQSQRGSGSGSGTTSIDPTRFDPGSLPAPAPDRTGGANKRRISEVVEFEGTEFTAVMRKAVNRCSGCGKRVGLTGFRCRCGELFCSVHRYTDRHSCSFDYKAAGREVIARDNPMVRAAKIVKI